MSIAPKQKPRLGRGLSSLISSANLPVETEVAHPPTVPPPSSPSTLHAPRSTTSPAGFEDGYAMVVAIDDIRPNPHQPRKSINETAIAELAVSIKSTGIIQPLVLRRLPKNEAGQGGHMYELIAGERRWLASKLAGLTEVSAVIRDVDRFAQAQMALIENIQREDLNPIERANGYKSLMEQLKLTQQELSARLGEDRSSIANYLRLLDLAEPVRQMVRDGRLSMGHAKLLGSIPDVLVQHQTAELVVAQGLSVRGLETLLQSRTQVNPPAEVVKKPAVSLAHIADLEKSLARQLGMRVQIRPVGKGSRGRLVLHYGSLDQFDELVKKLGVSVE